MVKPGFREARDSDSIVDLVLRISTIHGDGEVRLAYQLYSPSRVAASVEGYNHLSRPLGSPDAFRAELLDELRKLGRGLGVQGETLLCEEIEGVLVNIGNWLYSKLFPASMRAAYRDFRDQVETVLVISDESWIPWEFVRPYDDRDDDFFCMQFSMGRWLADARDLVVAKGIGRVLSVSADDLGKNQSSLPGARAERGAIAAFLRGVPEISNKILHGPTASDLKNHLLAGLDLLHFAGHGSHSSLSSSKRRELERPELAKIELAERPFRARELEGELGHALQKHRPFVFFNSCEGGLLGPGLAGLDGWAEGWVRTCGASGFLSPILPVRDKTAKMFAEIFYRNLREGQALGPALKAARREIQRVRPRDKIAKLSYSLHGHPGLRLYPGQNVCVAVENEWSRDLLRSPLVKGGARLWLDSETPTGLRFTSHQARFVASARRLYFINVTNQRLGEIEITHLWFEDSGHHVPIRPRSRPLPVRLKSREAWSSWVPLLQLPEERRDDAYLLFKLRLSTGEIFSSLKEGAIPPYGSVPGGEILPGDIQGEASGEPE